MCTDATRTGARTTWQACGVLPEKSLLKIGPFTTNPRINVYALVMLLVMYSVWEEDDPTFGFWAYASLVAATFVMLSAVALSHLLSESLNEQIRLGEKIGMSEYRALLRVNAQFLLTTIPVAIVLLIPLALNLPGNAGVNELIVLALVAMFGWGAFAGRRIGYGRFASLVYGLAYLGVGLLIVILKVIVSH